MIQLIRGELMKTFNFLVCHRGRLPKLTISRSQPKFTVTVFDSV